MTHTFKNAVYSENHEDPRFNLLSFTSMAQIYDFFETSGTLKQERNYINSRNIYNKVILKKKWSF